MPWSNRTSPGHPHLRYYRGMWDMGTPRVPPDTPGIVMTDRTTGTDYLISHDSGLGAYELISAPANVNALEFGTDRGPVLSSDAGLLRLYIDGGTLQYELAPERFSGLTQVRVLTHNPSERNVVYEITAASPFTFGDSLTTTLIS